MKPFYRHHFLCLSPRPNLLGHRFSGTHQLAHLYTFVQTLQYSVMSYYIGGVSKSEMSLYVGSLDAHSLCKHQ